jgi:DNA-binding beta-propeller fold protein YncE
VGRNGRLELIPLKLPSDHRQLGDYDIPAAIALDAVGHLFVAQVNRSQVLCIDLNSGTVTVYGGTGQQGFNGDWIDARRSNITLPEYLSIDSDGNLVVAELNRIRRIDVSDRMIATVAGSGPPGSEEPGSARDHGKLWEPANVDAAPDGSVYITSSFSGRVSRLNPDGSLVTVAGGGNPARFEDPGPALEVSLNYPEGLWIGESGEIYFFDYDNRIVRHLEGGPVNNFAITPKKTNSAGVFLYYAAPLVADANYFYLSDPNGQTVWRISRADGGVEAYAGIGSDAEIQSGEDSPSQKLVYPSGLAQDGSGNLFISDGLMNDDTGRILRIDAATRRTTVVLSHLRLPSGLAFQSASTLCFSETGRNQVRCLDLANHSVRDIAGTGVAGYSGDGGPAECARLNRPSGISFDALGRLYIADTGNQRVRVVRLGEQAAICHKPE